MCGFCDHRNPAGARFCNECAAPLDLKPCSRCQAVNERAATACRECGAACAAPFDESEPAAVLPAAGGPASSTSGDATVATGVARPLFAAPALRAGRRVLKHRQLLVAAAVTILIAAAYDARRSDVVTPDAVEDAPQPAGAAESDAPAPAALAVPVAVESKFVETPESAAVQAPVPEADMQPAAPQSVTAPAHAVPVPALKGNGAHQGLVPAPASKHASARRSPAPKRQSSSGATPAPAHGHAAARAGARVAKTGKARHPDTWQMMQVSLERCDGDLIARFVCDQRVRRQFCEGHWGKVPQCSSGIVNDHGQ
jgi:hypothetical protein